MHANRAFDEIDEAAIVLLYVGGQTAPELARELDCADETIYRIIRRAGVTVRHPRGPKPGTTRPPQKPRARLTGKPTAAPARFPYPEHRTLAQVDHDDAVRWRAVEARRTRQATKMVGKPAGRGG